jgi:ABC-2 type transport system permease protein
MNGFRAFVQKELLEIVRTWRIWVVPGLILFFAVTSPIVALLTPALVSSLAGSEPGVVIQVPEPIALDAYKQFLKNLNQIVLVALILGGAGTISGERRAGTAALVLTKPLSRAGFVGAKFVAQVILVTGATLVGLVVCAAATSLCFGDSPLAQFVSAVGIWWVYALVTVAVLLFFSASFASTGAAAGFGFAWYLVIVLCGIWPAVAAHSPAGLPGSAYSVLVGKGASPGWPVATAAVLVVLAVAGAIGSFQRKEL